MSCGTECVMHPLRTVFTFFAAALALHGPTRAETYEWIGGDGAWADAQNWSPTSVPDAAGDTVSISVNRAASTSLTLDSVRTTGNLFVENLDPSTRQISITVPDSAGRLNFDPGAPLSTSTVHVAANTKLSISSFSGTNTICKTGEGSWVLPGNNSGGFSGVMILSEGEMSLSGSNSLKDFSTLILGGGSSPAKLSAPNILTVNNCTIRVNSQGTNTAAIFFDIANSIEYKNAIVLDRMLTVNSGHEWADIRFTGRISGGRGIYKTGPGSIRFAFYDNSIGDITVSAGTIQAQQHNGSLSWGKTIFGDEHTGSSKVGINFGYGITLWDSRSFHFTKFGTGGATIGTIAGSPSASTVYGEIQIDRDVSISNNHLSGNGLTLAGRIHGTGGIRTGSGSSMKLRLTGRSEFSGGTTVASGLLELAGSGTLGTGDVTIAGGAKLRILSADAISDSAVLSVEKNEDGATGTIELGDGVTESVNKLILYGKTAYMGTYGAPGSGARYEIEEVFSGSGILNVLDGAPYATFVIVK